MIKWKNLPMLLEVARKRNGFIPIKIFPAHAKLQERTRYLGAMEAACTASGNDRAYGHFGRNLKVPFSDERNFGSLWVGAFPSFVLLFLGHELTHCICLCLFVQLLNSPISSFFLSFGFLQCSLVSSLEQVEQELWKGRERRYELVPDPTHVDSFERLTSPTLPLVVLRCWQSNLGRKLRSL